jgi:hypothetical protein
MSTGKESSIGGMVLAMLWTRRFYLSLPSLTISTISCVVIFAFIEGTSNGEEIFRSGTNAKVRQP